MLNRGVGGLFGFIDRHRRLLRHRAVRADDEGAASCAGPSGRRSRRMFRLHGSVGAGTHTPWSYDERDRRGSTTRISRLHLRGAPADPATSGARRVRTGMPVARPLWLELPRRRARRPSRTSSGCSGPTCSSRRSWTRGRRRARSTSRAAAGSTPRPTRCIAARARPASSAPLDSAAVLLPLRHQPVRGGGREEELPGAALADRPAQHRQGEARPHTPRCPSPRTPGAADPAHPPHLPLVRQALLEQGDRGLRRQAAPLAARGHQGARPRQPRRAPGRPWSRAATRLPAPAQGAAGCVPRQPQQPAPDRRSRGPGAVRGGGEPAVAPRPQGAAAVSETGGPVALDPGVAIARNSG